MIQKQEHVPHLYLQNLATLILILREFKKIYLQKYVVLLINNKEKKIQKKYLLIFIFFPRDNTREKEEKSSNFLISYLVKLNFKIVAVCTWEKKKKEIPRANLKGDNQ